MTRLTRKETHAQTRARLVETAHRMFLADGYHETSLTAVAAEAGYSKGAVYSNFATKHELGLAVIDLLHLTRATSLAASLEGADTVDELVDGFRAWAEGHIGDVAWTALEVEFATSLRHVPGMAAELAARRREVTSSLALLLEHQVGLLGLRLPVPPEDAAVQLLAMGIGIGVQRAFDPDLEVTALVDLLHSLLERCVPA